MIRRASAFRVFVVTVACAASPASAWADDTILRLSESATVMAAPDELTAMMRAEATAATAQEAQRKVNELMKDAVASAKSANGVTFSNGAYNVWRFAPTVTDRAERWQASQTLNLTGKDPESMQRLVGDLQQRGLAQGSLGWRLSRETERKARGAATKEALSRLRGRADEAADVLGMKFSSFKEVRLDSVTPPPILPRQSVAGRAGLPSVMPPPTVEAEDLPVTATADADIVLKPR
jgi:predicted secreted protein